MYTIDRKEGNIVICQDEGGRNFEIELSEFAYAPSEGDIIYKTNEGYKKDEQKTDERNKNIKSRFSLLFGGK